MLPFPSPDQDDAELAARIGALYSQTPAPADGQVERCAGAVLAAAKQRSSKSAFGLGRSQWWWGAAAAAVLITATTRPWRGSVATTEADSAFSSAVSTAAGTLQGTITTLAGGAVRFDLRLPTTAREVAIVGDFNGWDDKATPMASRATDGTWSARIALAPGRHVYAFVVDGQKWVVDPLAPQVADDGYGPANAIVVEGAPK